MESIYANEVMTIMQCKFSLQFQSHLCYLLTVIVIIQLEARLQLNLGFTFERTLTVFTRSGTTSPKVNRFGWNLKHSEYTPDSSANQLTLTFHPEQLIPLALSSEEPGKCFLMHTNCKVTHMGYNNKQAKYVINDVKLECVSEEKELWSHY